MQLTLSIIATIKNAERKEYRNNQQGKMQLHCPYLCDVHFCDSMSSFRVEENLQVFHVGVMTWSFFYVQQLR